MKAILLAVIVSLCAFSLPASAEPGEAQEFLQEGRASLSTNVETASRSDDARKPEIRRARPSSRKASRGNAHAISVAERYLGTNPTRMRRLWCANFVGMIEKKVGRSGSGSNFARSYASYGTRVAKPQPGDIAVMARGKRGGHVGYFVGWAPNGKAIVISGNSRGGKVAKGQYAASRIYAWRRPA